MTKGWPGLGDNTWGTTMFTSCDDRHRILPDHAAFFAIIGCCLIALSAIPFIALGVYSMLAWLALGAAGFMGFACCFDFKSSVNVQNRKATQQE